MAETIFCRVLLGLMAALGLLAVWLIKVQMMEVTLAEALVSFIVD